jgi:hypothetical protein
MQLNQEHENDVHLSQLLSTLDNRPTDFNEPTNTRTNFRGINNNEGQRNNFNNLNTINDQNRWITNLAQIFEEGNEEPEQAIINHSRIPINPRLITPLIELFEIPLISQNGCQLNITINNRPNGTDCERINAILSKIKNETNITPSFTTIDLAAHTEYGFNTIQENHETYRE